VNFFFETVEDWHMEHIGENNLMFQTDVPHPTGFYADGDADFVDDALSLAVGKLSDHYVEKLLWGNAANVYKSALDAQGVTI
jgi:predicted TIM-barrel fold metal-dependent hydrolase